MDFDLSCWIAVLAALLLVPGLLFLFVVVIYVAFVPKKKRQANSESVGRKTK